MTTLRRLMMPYSLNAFYVRRRALSLGARLTVLVHMDVLYSLYIRFILDVLDCIIYLIEREVYVYNICVKSHESLD